MSDGSKYPVAEANAATAALGYWTCSSRVLEGGPSIQKHHPRFEWGVHRQEINTQW